MDSTDCSSSEALLLPGESGCFDETFATKDESALSDAAHRLSNEPALPLDPEVRIHHLVEGDLAVVEADSKLAPYECRLVVTDEAGNVSLSSNSVVRVEGSTSCEKQGFHQRTVSLGTETLSGLSSDGDYESSQSVQSEPDHPCSERELRGIGQLMTAGSNQESIDTTDDSKDWTFDQASPIPDEDRKTLAPVPWGDSTVDKSDISVNVSKPPPSVITDLGDGAFHANFNATGRQSTASSPLADLDLQNRFFDALVRVHEEKNGFFPRGLLLTLVNYDCVFKELSRTLKDTHTPSQISKYATTICEECSLPRDDDCRKPPKIKSFKKIFAILVMIERTWSISKFLEEDVNDLDLPLRKFSTGYSGSRFELRRSSTSKHSLECFQGWSHFNVDAFEKWQWTTVSPFFHRGARKNVQHFLLQDSIMLPFTRDSRRDKESKSRLEFEGGYGSVFRVDIHPDHHNFDLPKAQSFAVKRLNSRNEADFENEVKVLKKFSDQAHEHVISLLATYEQFRSYFLIFPWADGDLTIFWRDIEPTPSFNIKRNMWVANQCEGIVQGLAKIHNYQTSDLSLQIQAHDDHCGRHGDLKPENILWFNDDNGGTLKITDFGLADFDSNNKKSYIPRSKIASSMSYRPPECDLMNGKVGQSYDIWTLGCLYLEFITWLLGGWALVEDFKCKRYSFDPEWCNMSTDTFFQLEYPSGQHPGAIGAMVKPAVADFLAYLHAHPSCSDFIHEFIDLVQDHMLVVKSKDSNANRRWTSVEVHAEFVRLLRRCEKPDYVCKPTPYPLRPVRRDERTRMEITHLAAGLVK